MPRQYTSLDEGMIPTKNRLAIKQYIKDKPIKWGIKSFLLCESETGYILHAMACSSQHRRAPSYTKRYFPCFGMPHSDDWERVPKKSLILSGPRDGGPYKREDFLEGLEYILQGKVKDLVITFGPLAKNSEWYIRLPRTNLCWPCMLLSKLIS